MTIRKLIIGLIVWTILVCPTTVWAEKVNLTKTGTSWIWRVDDGLSRKVLLLEGGERIIAESGSWLIADQVSPNGMYNALVGQGWTVTDTSANIPQGLSTTESQALDLALLENGNYLLTENSLNVRMEN